LTLLPLLPLALRPQLFAKDIDADGPGQSVLALTKGSTDMPTEEHVERQKSRTQARQNQRFLSIVICWALSFYPFFSRMAGTFGKQRADQTRDRRLTPSEAKVRSAILQMQRFPRLTGARSKAFVWKRLTSSIQSMTVP
jgi:hypothetical protein